MKFEIGDRARVILKDSIHYLEECTIASTLIYGRLTGMTGEVKECGFYRTDFSPLRENRKHVSYEPHELEPIGDANEVTSWDAEIFAPTEALIVRD